jgi:hypothetical protein
MRPNAPALLAALVAVASLAACGDARPVEGEAAQVGEDCMTCHGFPPPPGAFGTPAANHPASARCWDCHSQTVAEGNVLLRDGRHLDGVVNVGRGGIVGCAACHGVPPETGSHFTAPDGTPLPAHQTADCSRCHVGYTRETTSAELHGNGRGDAIVQPPAGAAVRIEGWDCTACHQALFDQ